MLCLFRDYQLIRFLAHAGKRKIRLDGAMFIINRWCRYSLLAGIIFMAAAAWSAPSKAEQIYREARKNLTTTNYSSQSVTAVDEKTKMTSSTYQQVSPDGIVRTRQEVVIEPADAGNPFNPLLIISNEDGRFQVSKDRVIKLNYQFGRKPMNENGLTITYMLDEQNFEGIPCYQITRKIALNQAAMEAYIDALPNESQKDPDVDECFPMLEIMLVGENDRFPRQMASYNRNGKLIGRTQFSNLILNPEMPPDLFQVPRSKVKVANSVAEYTNITSGEIEKSVLKKMKRAGASPWGGRLGSSLESWFDRNFSNIINVGVWGGIVIAVLAILAAILLKIRQHQTES